MLWADDFARTRPGHQCCQGHNEEFWLAMPQPLLSTALCPTTCDSVVSSPQYSSSKVALPLYPSHTSAKSNRPQSPQLHRFGIDSHGPRLPRAQPKLERFPAIESSGFREHTVRGAISACRAPVVELRTLLGLLTLSRPGQQSVLESLLTDDCTRFPDPQQAWSSVWSEDRKLKQTLAFLK